MVRPRFQPSREHDLDVTLTPMIDVVFLLLIFFVWTASVHMVEYLLQNQLVEQSGNQASQITDPVPEDDFDAVVIRVSWNGSAPGWSINDQPIGSVQKLDEGLQRLAEVKIDAPIIVRPDQQVPVGFVIEVYDIAKLAGFMKISFAVSSPESSMQSSGP